MERLAALDGWAKTSAAKLLDAAEARAARPVALPDFIYALGAPRIGKATAKRVAAVAGSWPRLRSMLDDADHRLRGELAEARGVGSAALEGLLELEAAELAAADRLAARLRVEAT